MVETIGKTSLINFGVGIWNMYLQRFRGGMIPNTQKVDMLNFILFYMPQVDDKLRKQE